MALVSGVLAVCDLDILAKQDLFLVVVRHAVVPKDLLAQRVGPLLDLSALLRHVRDGHGGEAAENGLFLSTALSEPS